VAIYIAKKPVGSLDVLIRRKRRRHWRAVTNPENKKELSEKKEDNLINNTNMGSILLNASTGSMERTMKKSV